MERLRRTQAAANRKVDLSGQEQRGNKASNGMVCRCQQVPMPGMWKVQQVHEDARKMYRPKYLATVLGKW